MSIQALFDISRLPTKILLVISAITAVILFSTESFLEKLHLENTFEEFGASIGIVFLMSTGIVLVNVLIWTVIQYDIRQIKRERKENVVHFLHSLTPSEQAVLREFMLSRKRTIMAPIDDPTIAGMLHKDMLYIAMSIDANRTLMKGTKANISIANDLQPLLNHSHVGLKVNPDDEDIRFINSNRPNWTPRYGGYYLNED